MITIDQVKEELNGVLYKSYVEDYSIDGAPSDEMLSEVVETFNSFERYGRNQKQWWRAPVLQMAGGDVHFFWDNSKIIRAVTSDKPVMVNSKMLEVMLSPYTEGDLIADLLVSAADGGTRKVGWREFFRVAQAK